MPSIACRRSGLRSARALSAGGVRAFDIAGGGGGRQACDDLRDKRLREGPLAHRSDQMEMLLDQIKAVEVERDAMLAEERQSAREVALLSKVVGVGPEFAAVLWGEGYSVTLTIEGGWLPMPALRRRPGRADRSTGSRGSASPEIRDCDRGYWKWPGFGCDTNRVRYSVDGSTTALPRMAAASRR